MARNVTWTSWPSPGALYRVTSERMRRYGRIARVLLVVAGVVVAVVKLPGDHDLTTRRIALAGVGLVLVAASTLARRAATKQDTTLLVGCMVAMVGVVVGSKMLGSDLLPLATLCVGAVAFMHMAPVGLAIGYTAVADVGLGRVTADPTWQVYSLLALGSLLGGYLSRQDRESRAGTHRLLEQEKAARAAEQAALLAQAESAALTERARIAREIHDVLANSLSAQLVHLEAVRLLLDHDGSLADVRKQVTAAQRMAENGLVEARDAVLALRGEQIPVDRVLAELADESGAKLTSNGTERALPVESVLTVRRVAREALTNVRKHAPGNDVMIHIQYLPDSVRLVVEDSRVEDGRGDAARVPSPVGLATSGSGYGLQGMRERAELAGGSLQAGPTGTGFRIALEIPT